MLPRLLVLLVLFCAVAAEEDPSSDAYEKAVQLLRRGRWLSAKRAFERFLEDYPESVHYGDAAARCDDNAYLGCTRLWEGGPPARRIDVAVMGDGFTIDVADQRLEEKWAQLCVDVLWNEKSYSEYRNYFNVYFVRLASLEEGVDPKLSPEERMKIEERNKRRARKKKTDFDTALDCKAAGPQGQVRADPRLVYKWLTIANDDLPGCGEDGFVIAFARFGRLGMGGGGIANVGRPDKSITVHEFGHAFSRLADEYTGNPNPPPAYWKKNIHAANASGTDDPKKVPWAHMLEKRMKGVGIFEGGATFNKGVWRPARSCAMNAAGATAFCPVCREATILVIYEYINPIDVFEPSFYEEIRVPAGDEKTIAVTPMRPARHRLNVEWFVATVEPEPEEEEEIVVVPEDEDFRPERYDETGDIRANYRGSRAHRDRSLYDEPPEGLPSKLGTAAKGGRNKAATYRFPVGKLEPGRYRVTVRVRDETPWVVRDDRHLLEERITWNVEVVAAAD